jgi:hypothetical protein
LQHHLWHNFWKNCSQCFSIVLLNRRNIAQCVPKILKHIKKNQTFGWFGFLVSLSITQPPHFTHFIFLLLTGRSSSTNTWNAFFGFSFNISVNCFESVLFRQASRQHYTHIVWCVKATGRVHLLFLEYTGGSTTVYCMADICIFVFIT